MFMDEVMLYIFINFTSVDFLPHSHILQAESQHQNNVLKEAEKRSRVSKPAVMTYCTTVQSQNC